MIVSNRKVVLLLKSWMAPICVLAFFLPTPVGAERPDAKGNGADRAAELFNRMHENGAIGCDTAIGGYVFRIFNYVSEEQTKANLANMRKALEGAKEIRIKNERTLGREPDVAKLDAEIEANITELIAKDPGTGLLTYAVRYSQKGECYRIEQFALPNEVPLDRLCQRLKDGEILFKPTYIRTWNKQQYAEILYTGSVPTANLDDSKQKSSSSAAGYAAISFDNRAVGVMKFTTYARDSAVDLTALEKITKAFGSPATVVDEKTENGEDAVILKVGSPESVSLYLEVTVLPAKGYCVESSYTKIKGAVMAREKFADFVKTSAGFWLPTKVIKEGYSLDAKQVPYLFSKEEFLAFEVLQTNVPLPESTFDLGSSKEFKALPQLKHLLP